MLHSFSIILAAAPGGGHIIDFECVIRGTHEAVAGGADGAGVRGWPQVRALVFD
jgi:hypothetical protein